MYLQGITQKADACANMVEGRSVPRLESKGTGYSEVPVKKENPGSWPLHVSVIQICITLPPNPNLQSTGEDPSHLEYICLPYDLAIKLNGFALYGSQGYYY
jgi:hypothetical protein